MPMSSLEEDEFLAIVVVLFARAVRLEAANVRETTLFPRDLHRLTP